MFELVDPKSLNERQRENVVFHKTAGLLADYGFTCIPLRDDWPDAFFLAVNIDGTVWHVQREQQPAAGDSVAIDGIPAFPPGSNAAALFARADPRRLKVNYPDLRSRQKENRNFHKQAAILSDYGFNSVRLSDDWEGADYIAVHIDGRTTLRVQIKGRPTFGKKYLNEGIHIGFLHEGDLFLYPHDQLLEQVFALGKVERTSSWRDDNGFDWSAPPKWLLKLLEPWRLPGVQAEVASA